MACVHEFGIVEDFISLRHTIAENSCVEYDPEKYNCIQVEDDIINDLLGEVEHIPTHLGSCYYEAYRGLAWTGITVIEVGEIQAFLEVFRSCRYKEEPEIIQLIKLFEKAKEHNKPILHYGI